MLKFSLKRASVPVELDGEEYTLWAPDEDATTAWRDFQIQAARVRDTTVIGMGPIAGSRAVLVSGCLKDPKGVNVPVDVIRAWPTEVVDALFREAKRMGNLDKSESEVQEEAKK